MRNAQHRNRLPPLLRCPNRAGVIAGQPEGYLLEACVRVAQEGAFLDSMKPWTSSGSNFVTSNIALTHSSAMQAAPAARSPSRVLLSPITQILSVAYRTGVVGDCPGPIRSGFLCPGRPHRVAHKTNEPGTAKPYRLRRVVVRSRAPAYYPPPARARLLALHRSYARQGGRAQAGFRSSTRNRRLWRVVPPPSGFATDQDTLARVCVEKALCSVRTSATTGASSIPSGWSYQSGNRTFSPTNTPRGPIRVL